VVGAAAAGEDEQLPLHAYDDDDDDEATTRKNE
jgi:hypothetical protein